MSSSEGELSGMNLDPPGNALLVEPEVKDIEPSPVKKEQEIKNDIEAEGDPAEQAFQAQDNDKTSVASKRYNTSNGNLLLILAFSVVVMADAVEKDGDAILNSTGQVVDNRESSTAIGLAVASFILSFLKLLHASCVQTSIAPALELIVACVLMVVWIIGVVLLTFVNEGIFFLTSSGFFATWLCLLISAEYFFGTASRLQPAKESEEGNKLSLTKGFIGLMGVGIVLTATVIAASALEKNSTPKRARAVSLIVFAVPMLIVFFLISCTPLRTYKDPFNFFLATAIMLFFTFVNCLIGLLGEPFAIREAQENFVLIANGFFSVLGLFVLMSAVIWKSHKIIVLFNSDNEKGNLSHKMQGRYIYLFLLFASSIVVFSATSIECTNVDGCEGSPYLGPLLGIALIQLITLPFAWWFTHGNKDHGDAAIIDPEYTYGDSGDLDSSEVAELAYAAILALVWSVVAPVYTFSIGSPFNYASSGFFFLWLNAFFANMYFSAVYPNFGLFRMSCFSWTPPNGMKAEKNLGLGFVLSGCIIQVVALVIALYQDVNDEGFKSEHFFAIGFQTIMLIQVVIFVIFTPEALGGFSILLVYLLLTLSYLNLISSTVFANPFDVELGNGFFGAWVIVYGAYFTYSHYEYALADIP